MWPVCVNHLHQVVVDLLAERLDGNVFPERMPGRVCALDEAGQSLRIVSFGEVVESAVEEDRFSVVIGSIESTVDELHLGDAASVECQFLDPGVLAEEFGIHQNFVEFGSPPIAVSDHADEVGATLVYFFETGANDTSENCFLLGESPTEIDISEGNAPFAAERTNLRENFFDQMLPLLPHVAEGRGDEDAKFVVADRCAHTSV